MTGNTEWCLQPESKWKFGQYSLWLCEIWSYSWCVKTPKAGTNFCLLRSKQIWPLFKWLCPSCNQTWKNNSKVQYLKLNAVQMEQQQKLDNLEIQVAKFMSISLTQSARLTVQYFQSQWTMSCFTEQKSVSSYAKAVVNGPKRFAKFPTMKPASEQIRAAATWQQKLFF